VENKVRAADVTGEPAKRVVQVMKTNRPQPVRTDRDLWVM
jgi:hypothetical protein